MRTLEKNNEFYNGVVAGCIGATVKYIFNELVQFMGFAKYDNNATAITVVLRSYEHTWYYWLFGFMNALIIGAFFGVLIAFIFSYIFNRNYLYSKAVAIGIGIWLFNFGVMSKVFNYPKDIASSLGDVFSMLLSLIIYSIVTVVMLKTLGFFKVSKLK